MLDDKNSKDRCCHSLNSENCTVKLLPRRFMVEPDIIIGACHICGKSIKYKKVGEKYYIVKGGNVSTTQP